MNSSHISPPLAGDIRFAALSQMAEEIFDELELEVVLVYLIDLVNSAVFPFLAEQFSLLGDGWELVESDDAKRSLIKGAIELHRYKGTPWAVREVIRRFGFGEVELIENIYDWTLDGSVLLDGSHVLGDGSAWARYRIILKEAITNDQADNLRKAIIAFTPARSYLESLDYQEAAFRLDGTKYLDGQYNLGSISNG
ncbi:phage tail protein I [Limnobaculum zhutongyuii]|uniref:Phage tail protein I n=1 Tax=Limnobaculum zhutongyuii TaxID=2498113 RepID=A0A411WIN4_9GAMM|nr:phage tail protein I [Limnobaculum zhutongyuii]QBH95780.1 phage tail protein I [Limnobaculum zhutongyuii]QBH96037.1 phage tail protein I [Limnobaculum zhutongyuii]TQS86124.1 phage tail protein I [Limnobaculum zhutongyuii]